MYHIDFNNPVHVHFIGIGGISMSGLAHILIGRHFTVSGSDSHESELTDALEKEGCTCFYKQEASNIHPDYDVVVYTAAISDSNPELARARELGIPTLTRAELLGQLMKNYKVAVNVAGTHGKTTTTSMITEILLAGNCDPTISVGGILHSIGEGKKSASKTRWRRRRPWTRRHRKSLRRRQYRWQCTCRKI